MENAIVIPCYNESKRLELERFKNFISSNKNYSICFVNDGSSDNTLEILEGAAAKNERIHVYDMKENQGKAEAVRSGINFMLENQPIDSIGFMDADLSTDFCEYMNLVDHMNINQGKIKMIFGSRADQKENNIKRTPFRKLMSGIIGSLINLILRLPVKDTQCGAKVFLPETAKFCFKNPFVTRWLFDVELFIRIKNRYTNKGVMNKIKEIPLQKWIHVGGSKISIKDSIRIPSQLYLISNKYYIKPMLENTLGTMVMSLSSLIGFAKQ